MKKEKTVLAWHVVPEHRILRDGRCVYAGRWYHAKQASFNYGSNWVFNFKRAPRACTYGMHACRKLDNALFFAEQLMVLKSQAYVNICRVEVSGKIEYIPSTGQWPPKIVGLKRKVIWSVRIPWAIKEYNVYSNGIHIRYPLFEEVRKSIRQAYLKKYKKPLKERLR